MGRAGKLAAGTGNAEATKPNFCGATVYNGLYGYT